jgi:hypothetical protein
LFLTARATAVYFFGHAPDVSKKRDLQKIMKKSVRRPAAAKRRTTRRTDPRDSIDATALITALEQHVLGLKEMTPSQVTAALALLKKTLPDMTDVRKAAIADALSAVSHEDALKELE